MSSVECTISAVATAAETLGYQITPGELNTKLIDNGGYTNSGWLIRGKVNEVTEGKISVHVPSNLSHKEIDRELQKGSIPVVKYFLPNGVPHWVVIIGKSGGEYLIKDSLDSSK